MYRMLKRKHVRSKIECARKTSDEPTTRYSRPSAEDSKPEASVGHRANRFRHSSIEPVNQLANEPVLTRVADSPNRVDVRLLDAVVPVSLNRSCALLKSTGVQPGCVDDFERPTADSILAIELR